MINESEKKELLSAILSSPDFRDAQRYQKLLIYLVETTLRGEAVKEITGAGESLAGRLWLFDGLSGDSRNVALRADPACVVCGEL